MRSEDQQQKCHLGSSRNTTMSHHKPNDTKSAAIVPRGLVCLPGFAKRTLALKLSYSAWLSPTFSRCVHLPGLPRLESHGSSQCVLEPAAPLEMQAPRFAQTLGSHPGPALPLSDARNVEKRRFRDGGSGS